MIAVTIALILLGVFLLWKGLTRRGLSHIPGPKGLPFIGIVHKLDHEALPWQLAKISEELKEAKGLMYIGTNFVVVDDAKVADEAMVKRDPAFADRNNGQNYMAEVCFQGGIIGSNFNDRLVMMRKAAFKSLHLFGSGLEKLEGIVMEEMGAILDDLHAKEGMDIAPAEVAYGAVSNILTTVLLGQRFSYDSEEVQLIKEYDHRASKLLNIVITPEVNRFPWLLNIPIKRYADRRRESQEFSDLRETIARKILQKYKPQCGSDDAHCVLGSLLATQRSLGSHVFTDQMVTDVMFDLILAGTFTTATSITGILFLLAHHPEVQERMYADILEVVGDGRMPRAEDKRSMPYVSAVILEALRYQAVGALSIPRVAPADTQLAGYFIPKNTMVLINQWALHHKAGAWEKPHEFFPEHFLDEDGNLLPVDQYKQKGYTPFGAGRRACLGETFAKTRLFLMVTSFVQRFKVMPPKHGKLPEDKIENYTYSSLTIPPPYKVQFVPRE